MGTGVWLKDRGWPKKRNQSDGGSWQNLATARGRLTCRAIPALRNGHSRRGPGKTVSNGIRGRSRRQELNLASKRTLYEPLGQTHALEVLKRAVGISIGLRNVTGWASWRCRPLPKRKVIRQNHNLLKRRNGGTPVGYSVRIHVYLRGEKCSM
jgi:hypothetical protein